MPAILLTALHVQNRISDVLARVRSDQNNILGEIEDELVSLVVSILLSAMAALPALSAFRAMPAQAQVQRRSVAVLERRPDQGVDHRLCRARDQQGGPDFVPVDQRIATFDNDGTLWVEQPMYIAARVRARPREGAGAAEPGTGKTSSRSRLCWPAT